MTDDHVQLTGNGHRPTSYRGASRLLPDRPVRAPSNTQDGETSRAQRQSLGDWLDIAPETLLGLSVRSLAALASGIEDGRVAAATVGTLLQELEILQKAANTDFLTGIGNRRAIELQIETEWHRAQRHARPLAILLVDIDRLKAINDTRGHPVGDFVIVETARRLAGAIRLEDTVARIGGDEYMVLCPETDERSARAIARKLATVVSARLMKPPGGAITVRVSIGWASTSTPQAFVSALVAAADDCLYRAKRQRHLHE